MIFDKPSGDLKALEDLDPGFHKRRKTAREPHHPHLGQKFSENVNGLAKMVVADAPGRSFFEVMKPHDRPSYNKQKEGKLKTVDIADRKNELGDRRERQVLCDKDLLEFWDHEYQKKG